MMGKKRSRCRPDLRKWQHLRRCPNTDTHRGVIKPTKSASLPWDFPFLFACLYKDFFFSKKTGRSWKKPSGIPPHWSVESPPQARTLRTGLTFSVLGRFLCSRQSRAFFLQVVKKKSDKSKKTFWFGNSFFGDCYKANAAPVLVCWVFQLATLMDQTWSSSNLSRSKTNLGMTLDSNEWVGGYQMRAAERMILQAYQLVIRVYTCGRTLRISSLRVYFNIKPWWLDCLCRVLVIPLKKGEREFVQSARVDDGSPDKFSRVYSIHVGITWHAAGGWREAYGEA